MGYTSKPIEVNASLVALALNAVLLYKFSNPFSLIFNNISFNPMIKVVAAVYAVVLFFCFLISLKRFK